jgi:DNA integrity scanning protein DisA with diadenylate cyclase activity
MRATLRELQEIEGISPQDAAEVQQGLRRLHDRHLRGNR